MMGQSERLGRIVRAAVVPLIVCAASLAAASPASAAFGIAALDGGAFDQNGGAYTKAGGHPDSASVSLELNTVPNPQGHLGPDESAVKQVKVDLPPGLIGNPTVVKACPRNLRTPSLIEAIDSDADPNSFCPVGSIVGVAVTTLAVTGTTTTRAAPVFSIDPPPGMPAQFVFALTDQKVYLDTALRSDGDYGLTVRARDVSQADAVLASKVTLWGVPAAPSHDDQRCIAYFGELPDLSTPPACNSLGDAFPLMGPHPSNSSPLAFLTNPVSCTSPEIGLETRVHVDPWNPTSSPDDASFVSHAPPGYPAPPEQWGDPVGVVGCEDLPFAPSIQVRPDSAKPDSPTGIQVDLSFPQEGLTNPTGLATASLRNATVTLPEGMTVSPSSADGLQGCSDVQLGLKSLSPAQCPLGSKIGTIVAQTPLLEEPLTGSIFVGTQKSDDPESGDMFRLFLVLDNDQKGIHVKLAGKIRANAKTGRLETTFEDNPQLPISTLSLHFKSGPRAPLATPQTCGAHTVTSSLTSWGGQVSTPSSSFTIDCPGTTGFSPSFTAGALTTTGGAFSPFTAQIRRDDNQQYLAGVALRMPVGLIAKLKGVQLCSDAQANAGACPLASRVGTATVGSGPGPDPFFLDGPVSLTGPYKGGPYGLVVAVRAVAGPFDLGTVVVRQAIYVDPTDAHLTVVSDPVPTIVKGVPLRMRSIDVKVDRPGFTMNPTSCAPKQIDATLTSVANAVAKPSQRFQVGECQLLAYKPKLAFSLTGRKQTTDGKHPGLKSVLRQGFGQANSKSVKVRLPLSLALDPDNADGLCEFTDGQKADPTCPKSSIVGSAKAWTPVLNRPLTGPIYFVKNIRIDKRSGRQIRTLPSLVIPLRGEVSLTLRAQSSVEKNHLVTTFATVPDAPVSRFELSLEGGKSGILVVSGQNICAGAQRATALLDGHNGKRADQTVTMKTPCAKKRGKGSKRGK